MAQNSQAVIPDNIIIVDGELNPVPTPAAGDAGKVLGVLNSSGDIGWVEDQSGTLNQVQSDWDETDSSQVSYINHKPNLAAVATSGAYSDLSGTPTIPTGDELVPSATSGDAGKVLTVNAQGSTEWVTPTDTTYSAGDGIAIDGSNAISADVDGVTIGIDSSTKKIKLLSTIPAAQVNADWNASSGVAEILNKPNLATVATSGAYSDLTGTPTIPTVDQTYNASSTNAQSGVAVASAISAISVDEVPTVGSTDDGKVLTASYSGGQGSYSWQTAQGGGGASYTAGGGIAIDGNNEISADVDGTTIGINATTKKLESLVVAPVIGTIRL